MKTRVKNPRPRAAQANARGDVRSLTPEERSGNGERSPLHTVLAILILPLSLGLALLTGIVALVAAVKRLAGRAGASR